jgi:5-methylcytosine-specific restriction endonuclease McrA
MIKASTIAKYVGKRFGRLTVLSYSHQPQVGEYFYLCRCDCGTEKLFRVGSLQQGTKSCGCYMRECASIIGKSGKAAAARCLGYGENSKNRVFYRYKRDAARRGLNFALSRDEFLEITGRDCFYCGKIPATLQHSKEAFGGYTYNGIDRVDNHCGYVIDNCVTCCPACNQVKMCVTRDIIEKAYRFLNP